MEEESRLQFDPAAFVDAAKKVESILKELADVDPNNSDAIKEILDRAVYARAIAACYTPDYKQARQYPIIGLN